MLLGNLSKIEYLCSVNGKTDGGCRYLGLEIGPVPFVVSTLRVRNLQHLQCNISDGFLRVPLKYIPIAKITLVHKLTVITENSSLSNPILSLIS